jgi:hypothetical protein
LEEEPHPSSEEEPHPSLEEDLREGKSIKKMTKNDTKITYLPLPSSEADLHSSSEADLIIEVR